jgi:predicted transcriptional regulator
MCSAAAKNIFVSIFNEATFTMTWQRWPPKKPTAVDASEPTGDNLVELTALVASSFVANNSVSLSELSTVIGTIHGALLALGAAREGQPFRVPAVPPEQSVTRDYIVCLEDGRRLKTLKRHIRQKYSLTPDEYRKRWHLPADYPMVAPGYSEQRSSLAKRNTALPKD